MEIIEEPSEAITSLTCGRWYRTSAPLSRLREWGNDMTQCENACPRLSGVVLVAPVASLFRAPHDGNDHKKRDDEDDGDRIHPNSFPKPWADGLRPRSRGAIPSGHRRSHVFRQHRPIGGCCATLPVAVWNHAGSASAPCTADGLRTTRRAPGTSLPQEQRGRPLCPIRRTWTLSK